MFTGLIEELGKIASVEHHDAGARLTVSASHITDDIDNGDSIAVSGVCLTALDVTPSSFSADVSPETLARTTLGALAPGSSVNLERAMLPTTRLGGHFVQGHIDATGIFAGKGAHGEFWTVSIEYPAGLGRYLVEKGSIAVEGISLTIARLDETSFDIAVIPKTWEQTNISTLKNGDHVNLEADVIAKYVERMMKAQASRPVS